jgi:Domain of unknown function (DUF4124)
MTLFIRLVTCFVGLCLAASAGAEIYKWVDANGNVQYSDQPPSDRQAKVVRRTALPVATGGDEAKVSDDKNTEKSGEKTVEGKDLDYRKRKIAEQDAEKKQKTADADAAQKKQACTNAQGNLKTLEEGGRIFDRDAKGEKQYLDDQAIAKRKVAVQKEVSELCK